MSTARTGFLLICLLVLVQVAAAEPYEITVTTDTEWCVAGAPAGSHITATVTDGGVPAPAVTVTFSCEPGMGTLSGATVDTDREGRATVAFVPGTQSGTAVITATATLGEGEETQVHAASCEQSIDHATPYSLKIREYQSEVTVDSVTALSLAMQDRYGNLIDARYQTETARFTVGSPSGDGGIADPSTGLYTDEVALPVGMDGYIRTTLKADRIAGENIIYVDFPNPVPDTYVTVYGIADGVPATISCTISPDGSPEPWLPADGISKFSVLYVLEDGYGNPAGNRSVHLTALPGEDRTVTTNSDGRIMITYGPKDTTGTVTLTATAADNDSVTCSALVRFTNTEPVEMILSANPQTMPSLDANPDAVSSIRAKVLDEKGNPVSGETVAFAIEAIDFQGNDAGTSPVLLQTGATTDGDGYASVTFVPGSFPLPSQEGYNASASATCSVRATWGNTSRSIPLSWKNYPFLSVLTSVDPETVEVNDTIAVNVTLRGDGWALQPDPIDVVLAIDRSGSMLKDYPDRMVSTKDAAKVFVENMNPLRDRIGLVSFGVNGKADIYDYGYKYWAGRDYTRDDDYRYISDHYPDNGKVYAGYATLDHGLSYDHAAVASSIDTLVPYWGTPMRPALYTAITELIDSGTSDVQAVILLSDGDWNTGGDPLAISTYDYYGDLSPAEQNMAVYAQNNGIVIYSIAFAEDISYSGKATLRTLAESTGGIYYEAPGGDDLAAIYSEIAGELKTEAGVDTLMDLRFDHVQVNNLTVPNTAADPVLDYLYLPGSSTLIGSWIENESGHFDILPLATYDNTTEWNAGRGLAFDVGTVYLNQTWTARFSLQVLKEGNINIFGPGSAITFNGGAVSLPLPDTFVTAVPDLNNSGLNSSGLDVWNLCREGSGPVGDFLHFGWNLNYTGNESVTQRLYYSTDDRHTWTRFDTLTAVSAGNVTQSGALDLRALSEGYYWIRVRATAPDARDAIAETDAAIRVGLTETPKIRIS
ncbi:hypothetical protein CUJ86_00595 [Methanofollis fontis]|uniref:VWFA domain-containing protein n=2 Tax=Methanofollis fontis TaxID=2052832 RepID=A0A483CYI0_9EURY|nr:hypothetical protein CUJ86_00595 [Methanofollis fontis]